MKKVILLLLIVAMIFPVIAACSAEKEEISVYFKDAQLPTLSVEKRTAEKDMSVKDKAVFAVNELIKGPKEDTHKAVINKNAKLLGLEIVNSVATVNVSKHYSEKSGTDELLLRMALVNTLCSIDGINAIVIQVDGVNITGSDGKEIPPLRPGDYVDPENAQKENVKLYFPKSDGTSLGSEIREVEIQNMPSLEKAVVTELIAGPEDKKLTRAIPEGTKLLNIETKDTICYVTFSKEFINNAGSGSYETTMILYSVVNSLCELDTVESVQILIEGKTDAVFGNFMLDIPYEANKDYNG